MLVFGSLKLRAEMYRSRSSTMITGIFSFFSMISKMKSEYSSLRSRRVASAQISILRCSSLASDEAILLVKMRDMPTIMAAKTINQMRDFIITFLEDRIT